MEFKFPDVLLSLVSLTALLTALLSVSPSSVSVAWSGWGWPCVTCSGQAGHQGGPGPHNSHCAAFSACDPGCCGNRPRHSPGPDNTQHSNWHSGQGSAPPSNSFNNIFNRNVFATFYQQPSLPWFLILTGKIRHIFCVDLLSIFPPVITECRPAEAGLRVGPGPGYQLPALSSVRSLTTPSLSL